MSTNHGKQEMKAYDFCAKKMTCKVKILDSDDEGEEESEHEREIKAILKLSSQSLKEETGGPSREAETETETKINSVTEEEEGKEDHDLKLALQMSMEKEPDLTIIPTYTHEDFEIFVISLQSMIPQEAVNIMLENKIKEFLIEVFPSCNIQLSDEALLVSRNQVFKLLFEIKMFLDKLDMEKVDSYFGGDTQNGVIKLIGKVFYFYERIQPIYMLMRNLRIKPSKFDAFSSTPFGVTDAKFTLSLLELLVGFYSK